MRVLAAFDKFKDALSAADACEAAREALGACQPEWTVETAPLADGGDGFCDTLVRSAAGRLEIHRVPGPLRAPAEAAIGLIDVDGLPEAARDLLDLPEARRVAIVEMAQGSGIALVPPNQRNPWKATSAGLGQMLRFAKEAGADAAIVGLGGSATHDLALGALWSLGFAFLDDTDARLGAPPAPELWERIRRIQPPPTPLGLTLRLACDVDNPLLGPNGAAAVFGPQKGLKPEGYPRLETQTGRLAKLLAEATGCSPSLAETPGAGAAGGAAFGLMAGLGARLVSGFDLVAAWIGLSEKLARADIVLTGEGRFDASSLQGKGPGAIARQALEQGKRLYVFTGSLDEPALLAPLPRDCLREISPPALPLEQALRKTRQNLARAVAAAFEGADGK